MHVKLEICIYDMHLKTQINLFYKHIAIWNGVQMQIFVLYLISISLNFLIRVGAFRNIGTSVKFHPNYGLCLNVLILSLKLFIAIIYY